MRRVAFLLLAAAFGTGCHRMLPPSDLDALAQALECTLPPETTRLGGRRSPTGAYWFVSTRNSLSVTAQWMSREAPVYDAPIPADVLVGLLTQHGATAPTSAHKTPGRLREWSRPTGELRLREFQTDTGWYALIELSRTAADETR